MGDFQHCADRALVRFSGELTHETASDLVDMLVRVYYHSLIDLLINSPDGVSPKRPVTPDAWRSRRRHA